MGKWRTRMGRQGLRAGRPRRLAGMLAVLAGLLVLVGCSSGSDSKLNLGLAGATSDHPAAPPQSASSGPDAAYAFVYDDQIWLHFKQQTGAKQLTHLVLSSGAAISWGPLVWSPKGKYIAFALVENLNPAAPSRASGPIYVVDADGNSSTFGSVQNTGATGNVHGHSYDWFDDTMLFYSTGGGIMMYGPINSPGADPRVWPAVTQFGQQQGPEGRTVSGKGIVWGDVAMTSSHLYYSAITLDQGSSLGTVGKVGTADLYRISLNGLPSDEQLQPSDVLQYFPLPIYSKVNLMGLGDAYADRSGNLVAGAWQVQVTPDGGTRIIAQQITGEDVRKGVVHATFCTESGACGVLGGASSFPLAAWPNVAISADGSRVAFTSDTLYTANHNGGGDGKLANAGWTTPPTWTSDGKQIAVTQVAGQTTDASGVPHVQTNIVLYGGGSSSLVLVPGGQDLAWQP